MDEIREAAKEVISQAIQELDGDGLIVVGDTDLMAEAILQALELLGISVKKGG